MYAFINHSSWCLYKNYIQIGSLLRNRRGFRYRVLHFQLSPTLSRKDNSVLTPRYWFLILFSLSVVLKYKLRVPVYCYWKKFGKITNVGWRPSYSTKSYWWATLMTQPISNLFMHEIKSESLCLWTMFKFTLCGKHWSNHGSLKQCFPVSPTSSLGTGRNW